MNATDAPPREPKSLAELLRDLKEDALDLVRGEVALAKAELAWKAQAVSKNAGILAAAAVVGYAGVMTLIAGFGALVAWGLWAAGMGGFAAAATGLILAGLLVVGSSGAVAVLAWNKIKETGLTPEQTIEQIKDDIEHVERGAERFVARERRESSYTN